MFNQVVTLFSEKRDFFANLLWQHIGISAVSILLAGILGLGIGILISRYQKSSKFVLSIVNFIYTIPSIALLGLLIPFSGIGDTTAIIALTLYGLLPMVRNTYTGIDNIDPKIIEAAEGMGSTPNQILFKIQLPLAAPVIVSGLRSMTTMTIALAGIASFIGAGGLGVAIYRGITTNNTPMILIGSLMIALLAVAADLLLGWAEKMMLKRRSGRSPKHLYADAVVGVGCLIVLSAFFLTPAPSGTVKIASKPMTEQYIMAEMLKELIETDTNLQVELTTGVGGGTNNIMPGMVKGSFDLYPEYTGTGWNIVLKKTGLYSEDAFKELKSAYEKNYNMTWRGMYGFNNTYAVAVRSDLAKKYNLKTTSDLAAVAPTMVFGAEGDYYEREDGYDALTKAYGLNFKSTVDMDIGLKYQSIKEKKMDATIVFTTDGQLASPDITVLEDDKHIFPSYMCGNIVRMDTLEKYPQLGPVLDELTGTITDQEMAAMNNAVETEGKEPKTVAHDFLVQKGLLR